VEVEAEAAPQTVFPEAVVAEVSQAYSTQPRRLGVGFLAKETPAERRHLAKPLVVAAAAVVALAESLQVRRATRTAALAAWDVRQR
jgi:hypothetical protein